MRRTSRLNETRVHTREVRLTVSKRKSDGQLPYCLLILICGAVRPAVSDVKLEVTQYAFSTRSLTVEHNAHKTGARFLRVRMNAVNVSFCSCYVFLALITFLKQLFGSLPKRLSK